MKPKLWPNNSVKHTHIPIYKSKEINLKVKSESKARVSDFKEGKFSARELLTCCYSPGEVVNKVKIKSLASSPGHPAYPHYGLFSNRRIPPNTLIVKYTGFVTSSDDYDLSSDYVLTFLDKFAIDANLIGNEARYTNDYRGISPRPNVEFKEFFDENTSEMSIGIWSLKEPIPPNCELLINYGKSFWKSRGLLK